jgi:hypothetical protein
MVMLKGAAKQFNRQPLTLLLEKWIGLFTNEEVLSYIHAGAETVLQ